MQAAAVLLTLIVATAIPAGGSASPVPGSTSAALPIATVVRHGGLCYRGNELRGEECRSIVTITDRWISTPGATRRALKPTERAQLLGAVDESRLTTSGRIPSWGTCPTAFDGQESIFRFRGFGGRLASSTYDLSGVRAVSLVNRLSS